MNLYINDMSSFRIKYINIRLYDYSVNATLKKIFFVVVKRQSVGAIMDG